MGFREFLNNESYRKEFQDKIELDDNEKEQILSDVEKALNDYKNNTSRQRGDFYDDMNAVFGLSLKAPNYNNKTKDHGRVELKQKHEYDYNKYKIALEISEKIIRIKNKVKLAIFTYQNHSKDRNNKILDFIKNNIKLSDWDNFNLNNLNDQKSIIDKVVDFVKYQKINFI